jgi:predicted SAM-dependent methyltransferase
MEQQKKSDAPIRLHLGCGETYLEEYVNIDFPPAEHTISNVRADTLCDFTKLHYEEGSVDEIRSHHVFEHFTRGAALKLLLQWRRWLKVGGTLIIETPDFEGCAEDFLKTKDVNARGVLIRHIFGSEEARWAVHYDGWYEEKFRFVLLSLGFEIHAVHKMKSNVSKKLGVSLGGAVDAFARMVPVSLQEATGINTLPNIVCIAKKKRDSIDEKKVVHDILSTYLVGREKADGRLLEVWIREALG